MKGMPGSLTGSCPILRLYGVTSDGNSVMAHVHGFASYLYTPAPEGFTDDMTNRFHVSDCGLCLLLCLSLEGLYWCFV